jgi:hypothetical protein
VGEIQADHRDQSAHGPSLFPDRDLASGVALFTVLPSKLARIAIHCGGTVRCSSR